MCNLILKLHQLNVSFDAFVRKIRCTFYRCEPISLLSVLKEK